MATPIPLLRALGRLSPASRLATPATLGASRFLLPRRRHASTTAHSAKAKGKDGKPRVLEKPDKFRPPSHGARLPARSRPKYTYGPALTDEEQAVQKKKRYPNMMPPDGSFMRWFLTNRMLHTYISLSVLFSLAFYVFLRNFLSTTPYHNLLPPRGDFWAHPLRFVGQYAEVYRMHTAYVSAETAEKRRRNVEDVEKRAEYRKAHGLEKEGGGLLGGWLGKSSRDEEGAGDGQSPVVPVGAAATVEAGEQQQQQYADFEGRKRPIKKWLGIW